MRHAKREHTGKRNWKTGRIIRDDGRKETFEAGNAWAEWRPKPVPRWTLSLLSDRDYRYMRARRTSGWKNSRCRRQWERKARRLEKFLKSRHHRPRDVPAAHR